jgi:aspartyl-tRNA synthetase
VTLPQLIAAYGDATNTSWLDPFWAVWRDPRTGAAVGFVEESKFAIAFGDPLCDPKQMSQVVRCYLHYIQGEKKLKPIWVCVDQACERVLTHELGWSAVSAVAEERFNPTESEPEKNDKTVRRKVHRAEREGVKITEVKAEVDQHTQELINKRLADWEAHRKGTQVHLTGLRPFDDWQHRKYFYAKDAKGTVSRSACIISEII